MKHQYDRALNEALIAIFDQCVDLIPDFEEDLKSLLQDYCALPLEAKASWSKVNEIIDTVNNGPEDHACIAEQYGMDPEILKDFKKKFEDWVAQHKVDRIGEGFYNVCLAALRFWCKHPGDKVPLRHIPLSADNDIDPPPKFNYTLYIGVLDGHLESIEDYQAHVIEYWANVENYWAIKLDKQRKFFINAKGELTYCSTHAFDVVNTYKGAAQLKKEKEEDTSSDDVTYIVPERDWNPDSQETRGEAMKRITEDFKFRLNQHFDAVAAYAKAEGLRNVKKSNLERDAKWYVKNKIMDIALADIDTYPMVDIESEDEIKLGSTITKAISRIQQLIDPN